MASLFEPNVTQVTPVQDTKVFDALGNIYNFLSKQSQDNQQRKQEQQRINDSLNNLGGINASAASASGANYRAVQKALRGISKVQDRDSRIGARDRATQNALYGKIDKGVGNTNKSLDKLKDSLKSILSGLTDFLKDTLNKSLKQQTDLARTMRKANLSAADKDKIQAMASGVMADVEKLYGNLGVSGDELNDYLGDLIASGKDITAMSREQLASFVALKKGGIEFVHAYGAATQSTSHELKGMVNTLRNVPGVAQAANDTLNKLTMSELAMGGGYAKSLKRISADAKSTYDQVGATALLAGDMADVMSAQFKYSTGQFHRMNDSDLKLAPFLDNNMKDTWGNLKSADTQFLASVGAINENLAAIGMSQAAGSELSGKYYSDKQVEENNKRNPTEGMLPHALSMAFRSFDDSMGNIFGQLANRVDELFGDSADVGKLVGSGFKIVAALLSTIVFNTTGGVLGILFRVGSAALAVAAIKKIVENKEKFKEFLRPVVDTLKSVLPPSVIETFKNIYNTLSNIFKVFVPLIETITSFTSGITDKLSGFFSPLVESLSGASGAINGITSSINNGNESIVDKIFGYLDKKLPDIGKFFGDVITPIASKLLNFLSGLTQQLWENTIKPLIPDLWNLLKDNWPLVLGAFAIKFLPDILGTLLTSVLPKLFINVLPKLIPILVAHPAIAAVVGVAAALGAGGMWLWNRSEERRHASEAAEASAEANKNAMLAGSDYIEARRKYGENSTEAQRLKGIYENTLQEAEKKRREAASANAVAEFDDSDAQEFLDLVNSGLADRITDAEQTWIRLKNTAGVDQDTILNAEREFKLLQLEAMNAAYNAQHDEDWIDTGDFRKDTRDWDLSKIDEEIASHARDKSIINAYEKLYKGGATNVSDTERLLSGLVDRGYQSKSGGLDINAYNRDFAFLNKASTDMRKLLNAYNDEELLRIAENAGIKDVDPLTNRDDLINSLVKESSLSQITNITKVLGPEFTALREDAKKKTQIEKTILDDYIKPGIPIDQSTVEKLAADLSLNNKDIIDELLSTYAPKAAAAKGAVVDTATNMLVGEDGREVILPLREPHLMQQVLSRLSQKELDAISKAIYMYQDWTPGRTGGEYLSYIDRIYENSKNNSKFGKPSYDKDKDIFTRTHKSDSEHNFVKRLSNGNVDFLREMSPKDIEYLDSIIYDILPEQSQEVEEKIWDVFGDMVNHFSISEHDVSDGVCNSVIPSVKNKKDGDKHPEIKTVNINDLSLDGIPGDDLETVKKILDFATTDEEKSHAFYDIILPNMQNRRKAFDKSAQNQSITDGHDRIAGTAAEKALEAGASQLGKPYILQSLGNLGYVCNELTNYALKKSGADLGGFVVHQVATTFSNILKGKDGYGQLKIRDDLTPETAPPGMLFFQDSKSKDGTFSPGHVGLVYYGHKRLHSTGGAAKGTYTKDKFLLGWQSNTGVVIDDFPSDGGSQFKFGELPSLFVRADGTMADVSAYAGNGAAGSVGLSAAQWDVLDDIFGYRAGSVLDYTNRWLTKEFGADITAKQRRDNKSAEDLENYIDEKSLEEYEASHKDLAEKYSDLSLEQKFANYSKEDMLAKSEIYETQSKLLKEGMGAATPKIPAEERVARNAEISDIIDRRVKDKGDILSALTDIASILREVARSTKRPVPTVSKPQGTRFP